MYVFMNDELIIEIIDYILIFILLLIKVYI